jgi:hypothetical protein
MYGYSKLNDQWCIRSAIANAAGQTVTVTKRNGATKQVTLGAAVGGASGYTYYSIAERPAREAVAVGDLSGIIAMFDTARAHLRHPAIVLDGFRISVAGARASQPGSLTITGLETVWNDERARQERPWFGRVSLDGQFQQGRDAPTGVADKLREFAADPAGVAAAYGRLHGACCFCRKALRDERSTSVGYGPDCASNYGLQWGARGARPASQFTAEAVAA